MDHLELSLEIPTLIERWQLARRFDAIVWFVRFQRENPNWLEAFRVCIPGTGPALIGVSKNAIDSRKIHAQLGCTGEKLLSTSVEMWHPHAFYLEDLSDWRARNSQQWLNEASISWVLSLHRDAWLAVARTQLQESATLPVVRSAWLVLALASADKNLLHWIPETTYLELHVQVYADAMEQSLIWMINHKPEMIAEWLSIIQKRLFFKPLWSRIGFSVREDLKLYSTDVFFKDLL